MTSGSKKAYIYGFDPSLTASLKEIMYFAGADPIEVEDLAGFSKIFKKEPPDLLVMSMETLEMLDFQIMVGSDPQFDKVALLIGVRDVFQTTLRKMLETCATDFFLIPQPYHLKRLVMAILSKNPWKEVPLSIGKVLLSDTNLERRIALARSLRIAKFDVSFAESAEDLRAKISSEHTFRIVLSSMNIGMEDAIAIFRRAYENPEQKRVPWLIYETHELLANVKGDAPRELVKIGSELSPDTIAFHVQSILSAPLKELRRSERLPYFAPVKCTIERINEEIWGYCTDISEDGIYIRTLVPPPPDTMLTITFKAPTAEGMAQMGARVAWRKEYGDAGSPSKPPGFGVQFARISVPDRAAIHAGYKLLLDARKPSAESAP